MSLKIRIYSSAATVKKSDKNSPTIQHVVLDVFGMPVVVQISGIKIRKTL
jgi:hypothetical protein